MILLLKRSSLICNVVYLKIKFIYKLDYQTIIIIIKKTEIFLLITNKKI